MNRSATLSFISVGVISAIALPQIGHAQATHTGMVERVWEDGFRLQTADQTLWVDASDLYGNHIPDNIAVGHQVSVTGQFGRIEFDAAAISPATPSQ